MGYRNFIYIMASNNASALYIGVTSNLARRIGEHKSHSIEGFTKKYNCVNLVYFEETQNIEDAIAREKQLKKWNRKKKETLIATMNPEWKDLSSDWD